MYRSCCNFTTIRFPKPPSNHLYITAVCHFAPEIGIRIRIAKKEKLIPEFELKGKTQQQKDEEAKLKLEADELAKKAKTESELIELEEEKIAKIDSMEEDEERYS